MKMILVPVILCTLVIAGCSKSDSEGSGSSSINCSGVSPSFTSQVLPLVQASCSYNSSCHASGSSNGPGALTTYRQIVNNGTAIRAAVISGTMPRNGSLSASQKAIIVCWIDNGAAQN